jgi:phosphoserine phosphatase
MTPHQDLVTDTTDPEHLTKLSQCTWAVFDLDSTLIQQETIDELAKRAGVYDRVSQITHSAMSATTPISFADSLLLRLSLLRGLNKSVWPDILANIKYTDGAKELFAVLRQKGIRTAIVSGGFSEMTNHVGSVLMADAVLSNQLEYTDDAITGNILGKIVDGQAKLDFMLSVTGGTGRAVCVGDGSNDIPMLERALLSVAVMGKPRVREVADLCIDEPSFDRMMRLVRMLPDN